MRRLAIAAILLGSAVAATTAGAQTLSPGVPDYAAHLLTLAPPEPDVAADLLAQAAFAPRGGPARAQAFDILINRQSHQPGADPARWSTGAVELSRSADGRAVNSLRVSVGGELHTPGGLPLNLAPAQFEARAYEVALIRDWPAAMRFDSRAVAVDLTPHAGVGLTSAGGSAEAGAMLRVSRGDRAMQRLAALGVDDGQAYGQRGRWYLFAAASGRAVGMNMLHSDAGWNRTGWSTDQTSALIGDAQLGVGWRKAGLQSSLGYIHREVKGDHMIFGQQTRNDSLLAFSLTLHQR